MPYFPTSVPTPLQLLEAVNNQFALTGIAVGSGDSVIPVDSTAGFPASGCITFEDGTFECVFYAGKTPTSFTGCVRGFDGTTAVPHAGSVHVGMAQNALYHNVLADELIGVTTNLSSRIGLDPIKLRIQAGTAALPTIVSPSDPTSGIFFAGIGSVDLAAGASHVAQYDINGLRLLPGKSLRVGSTSSPRSTNNIGATEVLTIGVATADGHYPALELAGYKVGANASVGKISFLNEGIGGGDDRIAEIDAIRYDANNSGAVDFKVWDAGNARTFRLSAGALEPIGFNSDLGSITNKWNTLHVNSLAITGIFSVDRIRLGNGTFPEPALAFTSDIDTGLMRFAEDRLVFITGGNPAMSINDLGWVGLGNLYAQYPFDITQSASGDIRTQIGLYNFDSGPTGITGSRYVIDVTVDGFARSLGSFFERANDGRMILGNTEARQTAHADNRGMIIRQVGEHPIIFDIAGSPAVTFRSETYPAAIISTVGQQHQMHMEGFNAFYSMRDTQFNKTVRVRTVNGQVLWLDEAFATLMTLTEPGALTTLLSLNATTSVSAGTTVAAGTISSAGTAFRAPDGTISAPGYGFTSDIDTGLFLTAGAVHYAKGGVDIGEILAGSASVSFPLLAPNGSAAAPSYSWSASDSWGFYHVPFVSGNPGRIVVAVDGYPRFTFRAPTGNVQQPFLGIGTLDPVFMLDINAQEDGAEDILEAVRINNRRGSDGTNAFRGIYITLRQSINNVGGNSEVAEIRRHMDGRLRIVNTAAFHSSHTQDQQTILEGAGGIVKVGVPTGDHWLSIDANGRIGLDSNPMTALRGAGLSATRFISFGRDTGTESAMLELVGNQAGAAYVGGMAVTNGATAFSSIETHRGSGGDGILKLHVKDGATVWGLEMDANPSFRTIVPTNHENVELGLLTSMFRSVQSVRHLGDFFFLYNTGRTQTIGHRADPALASSPTYQWPADGSAGQVLSTNGSGILTWITSGGVSWPLTATDYLDMATHEIRWASSDFSVKYSSDHGHLLITSLVSADYSDISVPTGLELYSNTGADGSGNWHPVLIMQPDGKTWIQNLFQGLEADRFFAVEMDQGVASGYHPTTKLSRVSGTPFLTFGYDANGLAVTGSRIQGTNLTIESLSPLNLVADSVNVGDDTKLVFGGTNQLSIEYSTDHSTFYLESNVASPADEVAIASKARLGFYPNTGADGSGNWMPYIELSTLGFALFYNDAQGIPSNRFFQISFDQGVLVNGFNSVTRLGQATGTPYLELGYDSDGLARTGSRIRGENLTIESLSPLKFAATEFQFVGGALNMNENELRLGSGPFPILKYSPGHGTLYVQTYAATFYNDIVAAESIGFFANTGTDGSGAWEPFLYLEADGFISLGNYQTPSANNYSVFAFNQGVVAGYHPTMKLATAFGIQNIFMTLGYDADGLTVTGSRIQGALPLILDFTDVRFRDGTPTAPSIRFSGAGETGFFYNFLPAFIGVRVSNDVRVRFGGSGVELPVGHELRFLEASTLQRIWANGGDNIQFNTNSNDERLFLSSAGVRIMGAYTLPTADGTAGQVMTTNGAGAVTFQTPSVAWPLTASDYLDMGENQIRFGSVDAFMKFDATNSVLVVQTANSPYAEISSTGGLFLDANVGPALDGNWDPNISLLASGHIQFDSIYQGTAGQRGFRFRADNGLVSGDYEIIRTVRGAATTVGYFGYRANGVSVTDALIRATSTPLVINANGADAAKFDDSATADDCRFLLWDVTAGSFKRVSRGAADSGGTGFRQIVIPN